MRRNLDALMQKCLAGIDAGLTPEECLSAWPERREELEPLLRQAMLLRVAFAAPPSEAFRERARNRLMFAAGREARQVLAVEPDPDFVQATRLRFLNAAGAAAQESLRSVPPPRLAFWVNARRRLLEAASAGPAASPRSMTYAMRMGLSAAVVLVLALSVAGMAYFASQPARPTIGQELAALEHQLDQLEHQKEAGVAVAPEVHLALASRIADVAEKITVDQAQSAIVAQELIERQKKVSADSPAAPQVQAQLAPVEERVVRIAAAQVNTLLPPTQSPAPEGSASPAVAGGVTSAAASPTSTARPGATATLVPLTGNQARLRLLPGDSTWSEFSTVLFSVELPASWEISGATFGANGLAQLETRFIQVSGQGIVLNINVRSGEISALIDGQPAFLRSETGERMLVSELVVLAGGERAVVLNRILDSVSYTPPVTPTPPASPTRTPTPPTATPTP